MFSALFCKHLDTPNIQLLPESIIKCFECLLDVCEPQQEGVGGTCEQRCYQPDDETSDETPEDNVKGKQ